MNQIKAIIFDWGRTLFDSELKKEFPETEKVVRYCAGKGYRLAVVSLVTMHANATLVERKLSIEESPLRSFFESTIVTDTDKDAAFDTTVTQLNCPRSQILIVDDRVVRGIAYGNKHGHPTIWIQNGKFSHELPDASTGQPTYTVQSLQEVMRYL